jgi:hypothetical protein
MRSIGLRLLILVATFLALSVKPTMADRCCTETVGWIPTTSALAVPTSYVLASSYVMPTSYVVPTVYSTAYIAESVALEPTTYLVPTYYETWYRRRGLLDRLFSRDRSYYVPTVAYYPTTYYSPTTYYAPTAYYVPTVYSPTVLDTSVVPAEYLVSSSACCGEVVSSAPVRSVPSYRVAPRTETAPPPRKERERPARVESEPTEEPALSSDVGPIQEPPARNVKPPGGQESVVKPRPEPPKAPEGGAESPPVPQLPQREKSTAQPTPAPQPQPVMPAPGSSGTMPGTGKTERPGSAGAATDLQPPLVPEGDDLQPTPTQESPAPGAESIRREARKPVLGMPRKVRSEFRNILFGKVRARDTSEPEEGVRVILSSRMNAYEDREALSDAFGRFAVRLPDGDWTVKVAMPSGRIYSVSQITVNNGLITDDNGRDIPSLIITR